MLRHAKNRNLRANKRNKPFGIIILILFLKKLEKAVSSVFLSFQKFSALEISVNPSKTSLINGLERCQCQCSCERQIVVATFAVLSFLTK